MRKSSFSRWAAIGDVESRILADLDRRAHFLARELDANGVAAGQHLRPRVERRGRGHFRRRQADRVPTQVPRGPIDARLGGTLERAHRGTRIVEDFDAHFGGGTISRLGGRGYRVGHERPVRPILPDEHPIPVATAHVPAPPLIASGHRNLEHV